MLVIRPNICCLHHYFGIFVSAQAPGSNSMHDSLCRRFTCSDCQCLPLQTGIMLFNNVSRLTGHTAQAANGNAITSPPGSASPYRAAISPPSRTCSEGTPTKRATITPNNHNPKRPPASAQCLRLRLSGGTQLCTEKANRKV